MVRNFLSFTEPEPALQCSQALATTVSPGPAESSLHHRILLQQYPCVRYPLTPKLPKMTYSLHFLLLKLW